MATTARAGLLSGGGLDPRQDVEKPARTWPDPESLELIPASAIAAGDAGTLTCSSRPKSPERNARARSRASPRTASSGSGESSRARSSGGTAAPPGPGAGCTRPAADRSVGSGHPPAPPPCCLAAGRPGRRPEAAAGGGPPAKSQAAAGPRRRQQQGTGPPKPPGDPDGGREPAGTSRRQRLPLLPPEWRAAGRAPARRAAESTGACTGRRPSGTARRRCDPVQPAAERLGPALPGAAGQGQAGQQLRDDRGVDGNREVHGSRRGAAVDRGGKFRSRRPLPAVLIQSGFQGRDQRRRALPAPEGSAAAGPRPAREAGR